MSDVSKFNIEGSDVNVKDTTARTASGTSFDNTNTGMQSTDVQSAVVEAYNHGGGGGITSHIGMIIHTTTLDTMAKVINIYGGTTWIQHVGYELRGASSGVTAGDNHNVSDGGSDTHTPSGTVENHTLQESEIPSHTHSIPALSGTASSAGAHTHKVYYDITSGNVANTLAATGITNGYSYYKNIQTENTGAHTHSVTTTANTTGSKGSGSGHNHNFTGTQQNTLDPYKNVYIWERTA